MVAKLKIVIHKIIKYFGTTLIGNRNLKQTIIYMNLMYIRLVFSIPTTKKIQVIKTLTDNFANIFRYPDSLARPHFQEENNRNQLKIELPDGTAYLRKLCDEFSQINVALVEIITQLDQNSTFHSCRRTIIDFECLYGSRERKLN